MVRVPAPLGGKPSLDDPRAAFVAGPAGGRAGAAPGFIQNARRRNRAIFLSDLHLGARAARPRVVLDFLSRHEADTIYLVGDVLDIWHGGTVIWADASQAVIDELEARAEAGVQVIYLPGNHDAILREPGAARLPKGWSLREALTHHAADGRRYLVLHGDQADNRLLRLHVMTRIGSRADAALRRFDAMLGRLFGARTHTAPSRIQRFLAAVNGIFVMGDGFARRLLSTARAIDADGVICGHSHKPMLRELDGMLYANCGDWVDSMTALLEDFDGTLRLVEWGRQAVVAPAGGRREVSASQA